MSPEFKQRLNEQDSPRYVSLLTKNTYGMVLAGGRGTRLKQLTAWRAKPAVPFGGKFRIIDFPLSNCVNSGIRRVGVATQYKSHSLIRHLQRGWSFLNGQFKEFIDILPAQQRIEENWYRGTADAVFQNIDILRDNAPEFVLIVAGDHIYKMDYGKLLAYHVGREADLTVACLEVPVEEAKGFGVMGVDDALRIRSFVEKPALPAQVPGKPGLALASMGIYVFNARFLYEQLIRDADEPRSTHDFGKDIIPYLVPRYCVYAHRFEESCVGPAGIEPYWRDVGTVDAYWEANMELTKVQPHLNLYDRDWPIWTFQEQLPPAKFVFDYADKRGMAVDSLVSGGCIINGTVRRSLLFSDVRTNEYSLVEDSVILPSVEIGRGAVVRRAVIDRRCKVEDGMLIGVDEAADRARFHLTEKGIRLVTPDMLGQKVFVTR